MKMKNRKKSQNSVFLFGICSIIFMLLVAAGASADTLMPLPPFDHTFSSTDLSRGYWFEAPTDFTITGLRVPDEVVHGRQNVEVVRFNNQIPPPFYSNTTNAFTSLARFTNQPSGNILSIDISVFEGDVIGILGTTGTSTMYNSYGQGDFVSNIDGLPVTLTRMGMQYNLRTTPAQSLWQEPGYFIGRVEMYYTTVCEPPPEPNNPDPCDGAVDVPVDTNLCWNGCLSVECNLPNGGFENGFFAPWTIITGPGSELTPWSVTPGGTGYFMNGFPFEGALFAQNGFDGDAGLFYDIYQEIEIPAPAASAVLSWSERIQWDMVPWGATLPRQYVVSVQPAGGGAPLAVLYTRSLNPGTSGDTGYVSHSVDLLTAAPGISGQTVRINFHEAIPQTYTGPAQFDLDAVSLSCNGATVLLSPSTQEIGSLDLTPGAQMQYSRLRDAALAAQNVQPGLDEHDSSAMNPGGAQAPQGERVLSTGCFTFGGAGESWSGASRLRANIITVAAQQTLSEIKMELSFSGNRDLYFYVFKSSSVTGPYTPVLEKVVPTVGIGRTFYSSGQTNFVLDTGSYYGIGVAWGAGSSVTYYRNLATLPVPWDLGMVAGYLFSDIGPPYTRPISDTRFFAVYSLELCFGSEPPPCTTTYDVYFGTDPCSLELLAECNDICGRRICDPTPQPGETLEECIEYFWKVVAKNQCGETEGEVWSFTTEGICNRDPCCGYAVPSVTELWSPNHKWVEIEILDVNDPDGDPVSITITGITQDEPVEGKGSGRTFPDGDGVDTDVARIRAERSGRGNGRIYEISFEADDGMGGSCTGSVNVCVPHDQRLSDGGTGQRHCIDDGQLYNSAATELLRADFNKDGIVNGLDFAIFTNYWLASYELND